MLTGERTIPRPPAWTSRALVVVLGFLIACSSDGPPPPDPTVRAKPAPPRGLQLKVVDDGSPFMKGIYLRVTGDAGSAADPEAAGITAAVDKWRAENGVAHTDMYLRASTRAALEAYFAKLATKQTRYVVPGGRELAFEQTSDGTWRSYFLLSSVELDGSAVATVDAMVDAEIPHVALVLTPEGAKRFGDLTARISGKKLATLVDGVVVSAQMITAANREGRATIIAGGADHAAQVAKATSLAELVRAKLH